MNLGSTLLPSLFSSLPPIDIDLTLPREVIRLDIDCLAWFPIGFGYVLFTKWCHDLEASMNE